MKKRAVLFLVLLLVLLAAVPVYAAPPVVETGAMYMDYVAFDPSLCPGVEIRDHEVLTFRQTTYFDKKGNVASIKIHFVGTDTYYNPDKPGVELSGHFSATTEVDLQTGEFIHASGIPVHITVPGYGTVLVRAGLWSRYPNSHFAGKDSFDDPKDIAAFCSLLAGG